jgi:hypothetical protein
VTGGAVAEAGKQGVVERVGGVNARAPWACERMGPCKRP